MKDHSFGVAPFIRAGIEVEDMMKRTALAAAESKLEPQQCRTEREVLDMERQWQDAEVVGRTTNEGRRADRDVSGDFRYTRIYVKRDGRWQAVLSQYTRIGR